MQHGESLRPVPSQQQVFGGEAYRPTVLSASGVPHEYAVRRALEESVSRSVATAARILVIEGGDNSSSGAGGSGGGDYDGLVRLLQYAALLALLLFLYRMLAVRCRPIIVRLFSGTPTEQQLHGKKRPIAADSNGYHSHFN